MILVLLPLLVPVQDAQTSSPEPRAGQGGLPRALWVDETEALLGETGEWTNRVEAADINGDGLIDLLFANGGDYSSPGDASLNRVFLNRGPGERFEERTVETLGETPDYARVIKVRDLNADGHVDIVVGTTFQTRTRLYLGLGEGSFQEVTSSHLPGQPLSIGDVAIGDVDGDDDLDLALADWGPGNNMDNAGGRTRLWLNDGSGRFTDVTDETVPLPARRSRGADESRQPTEGPRMPETLVQFSWDLDFVDVDGDLDLDLAVSCKMCTGSKLFLNNGKGHFAASRGGLPRYTNNYELEAMDLDGDGLPELVTVNDGEVVGWGSNRREHVFKNAGRGRFLDQTHEWWPPSENLGHDDNMVAFLDYDSDGDADFLLASLSGPDRLLINDGAGNLTVATDVFEGEATPGTLAVALADLDGDHRLDVIQAQGEHPRATSERIYLGTGLAPDTAAPAIVSVAVDPDPEDAQALMVRARIHDAKSPSMPHDWKRVELVWTDGPRATSVTLDWYGDHLWRARGLPQIAGAQFKITATDAAGNTSTGELQALVAREPPSRSGPRRGR